MSWISVALRPETTNYFLPAGGLCFRRGWELEAEEGEEDGVLPGRDATADKSPRERRDVAGCHHPAASTNRVRKQGLRELTLHLYNLGKYMYYAF